MRASIFFGAAIAALANTALAAEGDGVSRPISSVQNINKAASSVVSYLVAVSPKPTHKKTTAKHTTKTPTKKDPKTTAKPTVKHQRPGKVNPRAVTTTIATTATTSAAATTTPALVAASPSPSACQSQTPLYSYYPSAAVGSNNTAAVKTFIADTSLNSLSNNAATPPGYLWVYQGGVGSVNSNTSSAHNLQYLGYIAMASYNVTSCAAVCTNTPFCEAFNIYFERDPSLAPGPSCADPSAFTSIKCSIWKGTPLAIDQSNTGEWRSDFAVVITGSNIYWNLAYPGLNVTQARAGS